MSRIRPSLSGIPETMLWTLYGRLGEAGRPDAVLNDPEAAKLLESMEYNFRERFGMPNRFFAVRAGLIDQELRAWLLRYPDGFVVSLGEGLETQFWRVDNGRMRWLSVDLQEAIQLRETLLPRSDRLHHLSVSACDPRWMDEVDASRGVFVVAQGLLMYLDPLAVERLLVNIASALPGARLVFDTVPRAVSQWTMQGRSRVTPGYVWPVMPWGIDRKEIAPTLYRWCPDIVELRARQYRLPTSRPATVELLLDRLVPWRRRLNSLTTVTFAAGTTGPGARS